MRRLTMILCATSAVTCLSLASAACAGSPPSMDTAALKAYAVKPWNKAALMNTTVELGRYRNVPVVAEHPCSDVCPQYTVRIIHYRLPADVSCASIGGVEKEVLVPIAIAVRSKTFCIPKPLAESGQFYSR
ncbi:MAG: hypothetical protein WC617_05790 [Rhodanobacter sp.]|jgi:hypothetical protein